jgi:tetratricopeptide (TPR) repeat protein
MFIAAMSLQIKAEDSRADKAWDYINKNEYKPALEYLESLEKNGLNTDEVQYLKVMLKDYLNTNKGIFKDLKRAIEISKDPDLTFLSLENVIFQNMTRHEDDKVTEDFLRSIIDNPQLKSSTQCYARELLAKFYQSIKNKKKAEALYKEIGAIVKWQAVGVFENVSESGFDADYPPIQNPNFDSKFVNKFGAPIAWFDLPDYTIGQRIILTNHFNTEESIIFAQTFINVDKDQDVKIKLGVGGSVKLWVNDKIAISEREEASNRCDSYVAKIRLSKGNNRILIQVGISEGVNSNFICRLTSMDDKVFSNYTVDTKYSAYNKDMAINAVAEEDAIVKSVVAKIANNPNDKINAYKLLNYELAQGGESKINRRLNKMIALTPNSVLIHKLASSFYYKTDNKTMGSKSDAFIKNIAPNSISALMIEIGDNVKRNKIKVADSLCEKFEGLYGLNEEIYIYKIVCALSDKRVEELIRYANRIADAYPESEQMTYFRYLIASEYKTGDNREKLLKEYLKKYTSPLLSKTLSRFYFSYNNQGLAFDVLDDEIDYDPYETDVYINKAYFQVSARKYDEALATLEQVKKLAPYQYSTYASAARCYKEIDKPDKAIENYKRSLEFYPFDYDSRKELRELKKSKLLIDLIPDPNLDSVIKAAPVASKYPDDDYVILYDKKIRTGYEGGGSETKRFLCVKILNKKGANVWKEFNTGIRHKLVGQIEKAEIIKANGEKVEAEDEDGLVVFTSLEAGDAIKLSFSTKEYNLGALSKHFWDEFRFTYDAPCLYSNFTVLTENNVEYAVKNINAKVRPVSETKGDVTIRYWEAKDIPGMKREPAPPALNDFADRVCISTIPDWDYVSKWYSNISKQKAKIDDNIIDAVNTIFPEGWDGLNDREKALKIYDYIEKEIKYSSVAFRQSGIVPQKASTTLITKLGDCKDLSVLFAALCKQVGLEVGLSLVNPEYQGSNAMPLPSIEFEHAIANIKLDGQLEHIELTNEFAPFGAIYGMDNGANILDISGDKNDKQTLKLLTNTDKERNCIYRKIKAKVNSSNIDVDIESIKTGGMAAFMRGDYKYLNKEDKKKSFISAISGDYPKIKFIDYQFDESLDNRGDSIIYSYKFQIEDPYTNVSNMQIFKLPWSDRMNTNEIAAMETRVNDIKVPEAIYQDLVEENLEMEIPQGYHIVEMPSGIELNSDFAYYKTTYNMQNNKLIAQRKYQIKNNIVPAAKFGEYQNFYKSMMKEDGLQIAIKKK